MRKTKRNMTAPMNSSFCLGVEKQVGIAESTTDEANKRKNGENKVKEVKKEEDKKEQPNKGNESSSGVIKDNKDNEFILYTLLALLITAVCGMISAIYDYWKSPKIASPVVKKDSAEEAKASAKANRKKIKYSVIQAPIQVAPVKEDPIILAARECTPISDSDADLPSTPETDFQNLPIPERVFPNLPPPSDFPNLPPLPIPEKIVPHLPPIPAVPTEKKVSTIPEARGCPGARTFQNFSVPPAIPNNQFFPRPSGAQLFASTPVPRNFPVFPVPRNFPVFPAPSNLFDINDPRNYPSNSEMLSTMFPETYMKHPYNGYANDEELIRRNPYEEEPHIRHPFYQYPGEEEPNEKNCNEEEAYGRNGYNEDSNEENPDEKEEDPDKKEEDPEEDPFEGVIDDILGPESQWNMGFSEPRKNSA